MSPFRVSFLTLFPDAIEAFLKTSLLGKASQKGLVQFQFVQIRDFSTDKHRTVDDTPYGGGEGMVLRADVLYSAWKSVVGEAAVEPSKRLPGVRTVLLSPQGPVFSQNQAKVWAEGLSHLILVCGHYEGVDERFIEHCVDEELSIGDFVLTGGEVAAAVVADAVVRLIPGVVKNPQSLTQDSLEGGLLKYPQYTRPAEFEGKGVPSVLLSGNHSEIARWRQEQREQRTALKRPDLLPPKPNRR